MEAYQLQNALIFNDFEALRYLYETLIDDIYNEITGISENVYLYDHKKFTFQDFLQDILNIESHNVRYDFEQIYLDAKENTGSLTMDEADYFEFSNTLLFINYLHLKVSRDEQLEILIERLQKIIKKDAVNKISNFFLKCKYSPNTKYGRKYIQSLYDDNF